MGAWLLGLKFSGFCRRTVSHVVYPQDTVGIMNPKESTGAGDWLIIKSQKER
jgi:hypothetical protein